LRKNFGEYFVSGDGKDTQRELDDLNKDADALASAIEEKFIELNANEDTLPLFDFDINLSE